MKKIMVATKNSNKVKEMQAILGGELELVPLPDDAPEVVEDGSTFCENALKKAREYSNYSHLPTIAEDSGLQVDALDGAPGLFSARFAEKFAGRDASDESNNRLLLEKLSGIPESERTARFVCCMAYKDGNVEKIFEGEVRGTVGREPAGKSGFGYDPLFIPEGHKQSFGQLPEDVKNGMSHRFHAVRRLAEYLKSDGDASADT